MINQLPQETPWFQDHHNSQCDATILTSKSDPYDFFLPAPDQTKVKVPRMNEANYAHFWIAHDTDTEWISLTSHTSLLFVFYLKEGLFLAVWGFSTVNPHCCSSYIIHAKATELVASCWSHIFSALVLRAAIPPSITGIFSRDL